jgi:hypothetical protein
LVAAPFAARTADLAAGGEMLAAELIDRLRVTGVTLIYDQATRALRTNTMDALTVTVG